MSISPFAYRVPSKSADFSRVPLPRDRPGELFDKRNKPQDYQHPPEIIKSSRTRRKVNPKFIIELCLIRTKGRRPPPSSYSSWGIQPPLMPLTLAEVSQPESLFAHNDMNPFRRLFAGHLNHHGVHCGMGISRHLAHEVFAMRFKFFAGKIGACDVLCLATCPKLLPSRSSWIVVFNLYPNPPRNWKIRPSLSGGQVWQRANNVCGKIVKIIFLIFKF